MKLEYRELPVVIAGEYNTDQIHKIVKKGSTIIRVSTMEGKCHVWRKRGRSWYLLE